MHTCITKYHQVSLVSCRPASLTPGKRRLAAPPLLAPDAAAAAAAARAAWLQDAISLLLAVLALDRFADYVSDQVRERKCVRCARLRLAVLVFYRLHRTLYVR